MTRLLIPFYHSIADLAKRGDRGPISPYKGRPALLHPRQSPIRRPLFLQSSECLPSPSTYHTVPRWYHKWLLTWFVIDLERVSTK